MTVKLFYKTQRELAETINKIIDEYWDHNINDDELIHNLCEIYKYNPEKMMKDNQFTTILLQQCGKRRLMLLERILKTKGLIGTL